MSRTSLRLKTALESMGRGSLTREQLSTTGDGVPVKRPVEATGPGTPTRPLPFVLSSPSPSRVLIRKVPQKRPKKVPVQKSRGYWPRYPLPLPLRTFISKYRRIFSLPTGKDFKLSRFVMIVWPGSVFAAESVA